MSDLWPRQIRLQASSLAPEASLTALWSAAPSGPSGQGYADYASLSLPGQAHRVELRWDRPVPLLALRLAWPPGGASTGVTALAIAPDGAETPLPEAPADESSAAWFRVNAATEAVGVAVVQAPGEGAPLSPDTLRIRALAVQTASVSPLDLRIDRGPDGLESPTMPLHCDGDPDTFVDVSDATSLRLRSHGPSPIAALEFDALRLSDVAAPAWVEAWLSRPTLLEGPDGPLPCRRLVDSGDAGLVAGTVAVRLELMQPLAARELRLVLPAGAPYSLGLSRLQVFGLAGVAIRWRRARQVEPRAVAPPAPVDLEALGKRLLGSGHLPAERDRVPGGGVIHAAGLGAPLSDGRAGITANGGIVIPWGESRDRCLHLGLGLDGRRLGEADGQLPARTLDRKAPILRLGWQHGGLRSAVTALVAPGTVPTLELQWTVRGRAGHRREASAVMGLALRDRMRPLPLTLRWQLHGDSGLVGRRADGSVAIGLEAGWLRPVTTSRGAEETLQRHLDLRGGQGASCRLRLPLSHTAALPPAEPFDAIAIRSTAAVAEALAPVCSFSLPDPVLDATVQRLLVQSLLFVDGAGRAAYGRFPSVYAGAVFGLEEEWLLHGMACWGLTDLAVAAFRATLLSARHFDEGHPLRDLRACLAPWQADRLLRLAGRSWQEGLRADERGRLLDCGRWMCAQLQVTAARVAKGEALLPGLLPPWRYGGDLSWVTQSLHTDAIGSVGLACLAERLDDDRWRAQAVQWRQAVFAALRATQSDGRVRLHAGGGDPGDYHQLMACGFLAAVDFFTAGDPLWASLSAQLVAEQRLLFGLPRFDAWGGGPCIDAHYGIGFLLQALRDGRRDTFWTGLAALLSLAMDRDVCTFREVSPLPWASDRGVAAQLPLSRLMASEPCSGGVGVALLLVRHALVTEMPESHGRPMRRIRLLGGVPRQWWRGVPFHLEDAPTLAGRVSVRITGAAGAERLRYKAPGADVVEILLPSGRLLTLPGGDHEVSLR